MAKSEVPPKQKPPYGFAIVANALNPYRLHFHQRIVAELPEVSLHTLITHGEDSAPWRITAPKEIDPVSFVDERRQSRGVIGRLISDWKRGGRIIDWLKTKGIQVVEINGYDDLSRLRLVRWCHANGIPCMLWADSNIRGDFAVGIKGWVKKRLLRWILRRFHAVLVCGTLGQEYFIKYGADASRIFFVPYEPDYRLIESLTQESIETTRIKFKLVPDRRRIIFSGRLVRIKRADLIIDAFVKIADKRPGWDLLIVGDGPLRQTLVSRVPEQLRARVQWTGFVGDQAEVSALYRLSDVLVLPSDVEPWALVINEAAAARLAIIASDVVGAAAELVRDGVNGRKFPRGNLDVLTECLMEVTAETVINAFKAASRQVLSDWRGRADPIEGLRTAIQKIVLFPAAESDQASTKIVSIPGKRP